ncbi:MAG: hypothetical protein HGA87_05990 [Desulfobulbaceae bacterium]|nr:hypothetical protein [Desulfobulbaceae bacterium]
MKKVDVNGEIYQLSDDLNEFQLEMYIHLIDWKRKHISMDSGTYRGQKYDAILPDSIDRNGTSPLIYPGIAETFNAHRKKNVFRLHKHFYHMASSQAANINLFLRILSYPAVNFILQELKSDFASLAMNELDSGYCVEFWNGNFDDKQSDDHGPLGDKTAMSGTDADMAIAYYNHQGELCLWLIEHKLTEKEFTTCGGYRSENRKKENADGLSNYNCEKSFPEILRRKELCYYHGKRKYRYWDITQTHKTFFLNHDHFDSCPFKGGINQLWRNQLLALAIEDDTKQPYQKVYFSVVRHPENIALLDTLKDYRNLIEGNERFFCFTSKDVLCAAEKHADKSLEAWIRWYKELYKLS